MSGDRVTGAPRPPEPKSAGGPPKNWEHHALYHRVVAALHALPGFFKTSLNISGARVADLHTLNSALAASIEQSVVENLNALRAIWDPDKEYQLYSFVRQHQVFPDVRLQTTAPLATPIIMGIELKGWFALAKEGEPSFRYKVNPGVCAPADLLVVYPWALDEVVSGKPRLMEPFIAEARWAALHRNHYWSHLRGVTGTDAAITAAAHREPYPKKGDKISDEAVKDSGGNFGRVARGKIMEDFIDRLYHQPIAGVPISAWQQFFKIFTDTNTEANIRKEVEAIKDAVVAELEKTEEGRELLREFAEMLPAIVETFGNKPQPPRRRPPRRGD